MTEMKVNQCDGCLAGIPVDENDIHWAPYPSGPMKCQKEKYHHELCYDPSCPYCWKKQKK